MNNTAPLNVLGDFSMTEDTLVVHPNDGFDLGLMTVSHPVYIYRGISLDDFKAGNGERVSGKIHLKNECRLGTVEMSLKSWEKIGKPKKVQLYYENPNLLIYAPPPEK
jgi:hypothetical protein